jgi:hypothetical protein
MENPMHVSVTTEVPSRPSDRPNRRVPALSSRWRIGIASAAIALATIAGQLPPVAPVAASGGYYGVERRDGRSWLTTPAGDPFFSVAVDYVTPGGMTAKDGTNPYRGVMEAKYGAPVNQQAWAASTGDRLKSWGINTVGAYSSGSGGTLGGLPDTPQLFPLHGGVIPAIRKTNGGGDAYPLMVVSPNDNWDFHRLFVDVYNPVFAQQVDAYMAAQLPSHANDPRVMGYFLDNELPFYYLKPEDLMPTDAAHPGAQTLADRYIALPAGTSGKDAWVALVRSRYGDDIGAVNTTWGTGYGSFDALGAMTDLPGTNAARAADKSAYLTQIAQTYFGTLRAAFRARDSHHLILGARFVALEGIDTPREVLAAAGQYENVVSINYYIWANETYAQRRERVRTRYAEFARATGRPILNGEFSFGARDSGLPNTRPLGQLVDTQAQRAQLYTDMVRITAEIPEAVGVAWWGYIDPPVNGALNGGEDGNYGVVDNQDRPYVALTNAMSTINPQTVAIHQDAPPTLRFPDVSSNTPAGVAITEMVARGIIRGYPDGTFGPADPALRAQMAAMICRAMGWDTEDWGNPFSDQGRVDHDLWRNAGTLARYGVARGYGDGTYNPTGNVLYSQSAFFITRAMVQKGYWVEQPENPTIYPNVPHGTPAEIADHRDLVTYVHYAGALPGTDATGAWGAWDQPATRAWFSQALWQALSSYFGTP